MRLIFTPDPSFASQPDFRVARGMLTPYCLQALAAAPSAQPLPITTVLIGPSMHQTVNLDAARMRRYISRCIGRNDRLLLDKPDYGHVALDYSKTPYRG